ncbi:putative uncharacterized protein DDB_G0286901 [Harpegnathos saltator]|nr:putative uncharacterized protein DDB_G0286901 [Harpegnathos saltator]
MSPNKRRMIVSDESSEDDTFKHRRSSLRVNLSYFTNFTDSGNESLGRTEAENDEKRMDKSQIDRRSSRNKHLSNSHNKTLRATGKKGKYTENKDSKVSLQVKGIQLKHLTINLEDISAKEHVLDTNCKRLKDAILNKTKEIFDKQDELTVKTTKILANQENCSISNMIHNLNADKSTSQHSENKKSMICNQYIDIANKQRKENECLNIDATPKNGERRNSEKVVDRSKVTPKYLFAEKRKKQGCRIITDVIVDKPFSLFPLKQVDQCGSPIISGSNRRLRLSRSRSKLFSQNQSENYNKTHLTAYSDHSINIGQPITSSTFIENNTKNEEGSHHDEVNQQSNINISQPMHTINTLVSMNMTETHGGIQFREKYSSLSSGNSCNSIITTEKEEFNNKNMEQDKNGISAQVLQNIDNSFNKLILQNSSTHSDIANNSNAIDVCSKTRIISTQSASAEEMTFTTRTCDALQAQKQNNQIMKQNKKQCTLNLSDNNSIRSSLNVNTSLDAVIGNSKEKNIKELDDHGITDRCLKITINDKESIILDNQRESTNTNRTSLQVNTSIDSICDTWRRKNNHFNEQSLIENKKNKHPIDCASTDNRTSLIADNMQVNDVDSLENISLIERLRNITMWDKVPHNDKWKIPEMENKERTDIKSSNVISAKFQSSDSANNNSRDSHSYVEGTPYPISRSVLFKMQLKHKTQNSNNNEENNDRTNSNDSNLTSISNNMHMSTETSKEIENDTVILKDSALNCNFSLNQEKPTIIEDTLNKTGLEINEGNTTILQNAEYVPKKRGKRKLLPLNENSQLCSIELIKEHSDTSEKSVSIRRNKKKLKKKRPKKKPIDPKNDASSVEDNIVSKQVSSDDDYDYDIPENKKKTNKKTQKPKKIVSKKIVIKKFVNENMLSMIAKDRQDKGNLSTENRNSIDDFVAHRMISTQWNKYKSQNIVIVTTGLSIGDKSLVKSIVKSLGMAKMELNVSRHTTHVVSTGVRTVNLLRGIIRGCWLITLEWVLKSLESNVWLNPEEFEMKHFSKAVMENREDRQLFGLSYIPELFTACGFIYVEHKTTMPCDTLKELIKTAGGHITENPKLARITVGANGLKETWVIDSITTGELQSTKLYQKK